VAQVDYFLKIEGVEGEATDSKHAKEIEVLSWSFGETNAGSSGHGTGAGAGKVSMQDFHFTMTACKASPRLFICCATGEHLKKATLVCRKAGKEQQEYMTWVFTDVLISSYQTGGSPGDVVPTDQISFNYTKIEFEYKPQKNDGTLDAALKSGYDLKLNKNV